MKKLLSLFFLVLISLPIVGDVIGISRGQSLDENRFIKGYDELSLPQKIALYIKNFDRQFWGRSELVRSFITIKRDFLGISPLPEKVVIGKSDWLYLADYGAMDDCRNTRPFTKLQLDSIHSNLQRISQELKNDSTVFIVAVVPDKHTIYPEYLPENVKKINPISRLQQLTEFLKSETSFYFINLTDTLLASKPSGVLYFKEESHWTDLGAYIGYVKIMKTIHKSFPRANALALNSCEMNEGNENDLDLAKLLGYDIDHAEQTLKIRPPNKSGIQTIDHQVVIPSAKRFNPNYAFKKLNDSLTGPTIIVYRDSFFGALTPFFEQSFSTSTYIWTNDIDLNYVREQSPSVVLLEIAERHIDLLTK